MFHNIEYNLAFIKNTLAKFNYADYLWDAEKE
jgi:hypothetical protein